MRILFLALLLSTPALAISPVVNKKTPLLAKIYDACLKNSAADGKAQGPVCDCLRGNYDRRFNEGEMEILSKIQNGSIDKASLVLDADQSVLDFDQLASEKCVDDPAWHWVPSKEDKKAEILSKGILTPEVSDELPQTVKKLPAKKK